MPEFRAFPKIPRLSSPYIITEKLDGSNATVVIEEYPWTSAQPLTGPELVAQVDTFPTGRFNLYAQSRNRFITQQADNFGFAGWVRENAEELVQTLGAGYHVGEWWGHGIQRGYGLPRGERRFSLFNVTRRNPLGSMADLEAHFAAPPAGREPLFPDLPDDRSLRAMSHMVDRALAKLSLEGSTAVKFDRPEGVILWHARSGQAFKAFVNDAEKAAEVAKRPEKGGAK